MDTRKMARFRIRRNIVIEDSDNLSKVFAFIRFLPLRVECMYGDYFLYEGLSNRFRESGVFFEPPEVELVAKWNGDELLSVD